LFEWSLILQVNVRGCLYHGWEMLGSVINSPERRITEGATIQWNEPFVFDVSLTNLPRMARLCFMLYTSSDRRENNTMRPSKGEKKGRLPTGGGNKKVGAAKVCTVVTVFCVCIASFVVVVFQ
jgi:Phosphoinositide 3-kinase C2